FDGDGFGFFDGDFAGARAGGGDFAFAWWHGSALPAGFGGLGHPGPDFGFGVAAVAAGGADGGEFPGAGPAGDGFGVDAEDVGDFAGGEQPFVADGHGVPAFSARRASQLTRFQQV